MYCKFVKRHDRKEYMLVITFSTEQDFKNWIDVLKNTLDNMEKDYESSEVLKNITLWKNIVIKIETRCDDKYIKNSENYGSSALFADEAIVFIEFLWSAICYCEGLQELCDKYKELNNIQNELINVLKGDK